MTYIFLKDKIHQNNLVLLHLREKFKGWLRKGGFEGHKIKKISSILLVTDR